MGTQRLEASLRRRLLALAAPLLGGVAIAAVAVTRSALDSDDSSTARERAEALLREFARERAEGDSMKTVIAETLGDADADRLAVVLSGPLPGERHTGARTLPPRLTSLEPGSCATQTDTRGVVWHACRVVQGSPPLDLIAGIDVSAHARVVQSLARWMALVVAVAIGGLVMAARLAVRRPLVALERLVRWSEHALDANPPQPPPTAETAEIQRLSLAFSSLVERLMDALSRERATTAHIAHELRTPLTALRAEAERLDDRGAGQPQRMLADIDRLSRVIDSILVLAAPATRRDGEIVNVADLARTLAAPVTHVDAPDEALVEADGSLIELALRNLLDNAEKFGGHPARSIRVARMDGSVCVTVSDDGPGVDESQLDRIFDRYWRATGDGAGTGLGLALVRAVAERYGGWARATRAAGGTGLDVSVAFGPLTGWHAEAPDSGASIGA